jgi:hypothetical protein
MGGVEEAGPEWGSPVSRSLVEPYTQADMEEP